MIEKALHDSNVEVITAGTAEEGLELLRQHGPDVMLLDIRLPGAPGLEITQQVQVIDPKLPVAYITVSDDSNLAIEAMKRGAYDFLLKPLDVQQVQDVVERALEIRRRMLVPVKLSEAPSDAENAADQEDVILGRSSKMLNVYKEIGRVAARDVTVLICGESGTGKELVARAIYHHSGRKERPFLAVNCAALTETLLESELFGHEKGSFTGADQRRIGKFEQCNGGTIFLDEVGDMSPSVQSKVLRLLQEQKFQRVGGTESIQTDVRIITATNRDLEAMVDEGEFRLDLFHRLNDYRIDLPPLRERDADIQLLVEQLLRRFARELDKDVQGISPEALELLQQHHWPGNVRELQTALRKAVLRATGPVLVSEFFPASIQSGGGADGTSDGDDDELPHDLKRYLDERQRAGSRDLYAETLAMMERYLITRIVRETGGNQSQAAERLGITRGSLRHKLRALGISIEQVVQTGE